MASDGRHLCYRFGSFELQVGERRLLKSDSPVALQPRTFDVLATLLAHAGSLVTKEQLLASVWPNVVVEDAVIHVQVSTLRKILGHDAIDTVAGRGYRFMLPVANSATEHVPSCNLPAELTSFIGREQEISQIRELLAAHRLVTLTGTGGVGKTRLALRIAREAMESFRDGACIVELAALADSRLVVGTIARALGLEERPGTPLFDTIGGHLAARHLLLILDNAEHLIDECASLVEQMLRRAAQVAILATSRERLALGGEVVFRVPSLTVPAAGESAPSLHGFESVRLFLDRARLFRPGFVVTDDNAGVVASICHRLDGIPLAIELAAPRLRSMSVRELSDRLEHRFTLLSDGSRAALPRHRTLRSMVDWSYDLLSEREAAMFRRLSVFVGAGR